jgi:hypothetical protein
MQKISPTREGEHRTVLPVAAALSRTTIVVVVVVVVVSVQREFLCNCVFSKRDFDVLPLAFVKSGIQWVCLRCGTRIAQTVRRFAMGRTVWGSNAGGGKRFFVLYFRPHVHWDPPSLIFSDCRVFFPGVKRVGRGVNHSSPFSAEVNERVELYLCSLFRPACHVAR